MSQVEVLQWNFACVWHINTVFDIVAPCPRSSSSTSFIRPNVFDRHHHYSYTTRSDISSCNRWPSFISGHCISPLELITARCSVIGFSCLSFIRHRLKTFRFRKSFPDLLL